MITHKYRTVDVLVDGGSLRVGVWDPIEVGENTDVPSVLAVHGVTSSHLAWPFVVSQLPATRVIAPDLRGRGSSNTVVGTSGMRVHATDLETVLDFFGMKSIPVIGHSMGGFVAVMLAHVAPSRVERLVLIDGGLPFDVPAGLDPGQLVQAILGATADRLRMHFESVAEYLDYWRRHPAFAGAAWSSEVEAYFAYDLTPMGAQLRSATSLQTTIDDTIDMNTGTALTEALDALARSTSPVLFVTVPRGLSDEPPGLYPPQYLSRILPRMPAVRHVALDDLNHYTVVMSQQGAVQLGAVLRSELT